MSANFRFNRPQDLSLVAKPSLSVAVVIACKDGQEKLDLVLASLASQSYPSRLISVYIIDDGSSNPIVIPAISPKNTRLVKYKNSPSHWGKTAATNHVAAGLKEDVLWFIDADMVFEPHHLAHHMKWHHAGDDFASWAGKDSSINGSTHQHRSWSHYARVVFTIYIPRAGVKSCGKSESIAHRI